MEILNHKTIKGNSGVWEIVIGLEVHAQVTANLKLFSNASAEFKSLPNDNLDLLDLGLPGILPVINSIAIDQAIKTGLAINAKINKRSVFDRKNYFYADLPLGYQISQFKDPIVGEGFLKIYRTDSTEKIIGIERLHLEQDAGKSMHDQYADASLIDFNRAGVALMEIVSKPDMRDWDEAGAYVHKLRNTLRFIGTCDGNMEEGSLRCDANVSVRRPNDKLGTRCEIKNLNSIKNMMKAIEYEAERQVKIIENSEKIKQQTRLYDAGQGVTRSMRSKEEAHDYRYFPDPDLLPLVLSSERIDKIKKTLPELPDELQNRLKKDYELSSYDARVLSAELEIAKYFEALAVGRNSKLAANWIITNLFSLLNENNISIKESPINVKQLGELIDLIEEGVISNRIAKEVFEEMFDTSKSAKDIVSKKGLQQLSNEDELENIIKKIINNSPEQKNKFLEGNEKIKGWFIGQIMKETKGKANPSMVNSILIKTIKK